MRAFHPKSGVPDLGKLLLSHPAQGKFFSTLSGALGILMKAGEGPGMATAAISKDEGRRGRAAAMRERFIPVRKTDIVNALVEHGRLANDHERQRFRRLSRLLGAIYHNIYFERLERLRDDYYYFAPDLDPHARFDRPTQERAYADLVETFGTVMRAADFIEVSQSEIERAHREHPVLQVEVEVSTKEFREVRFFERGRHMETFEVKDWFGLRKRKVAAEVHDDVVLFVAVKPEVTRRGVSRLRRSKLRPGAVLLKYFRNIATADLRTLVPNARVVLSLGDKLSLGLPAVIGAVPLGAQLVPTVSALFLVAGAYLGVAGEVEGDRVKMALAALSGLAAVGAFMMRQWVKYQRQALQHQKILAENVYFRNLNNNMGIFDYIVGTAEEQETKEALLAYYFLLTAPTPLHQRDLEQSVESWLKETFDVEANFVVEEALGKIERLGLLVRDQERLSVLPLDAALAHLDQVWADFHNRDAIDA
jgi:hypothetical protein